MTPYYSDQWVSIYHGDAWEIAPQLSGISAIVTSPPYNQLEDLPETGSGLWAKSTGGAGFLRAWSESGYTDAVPESEYQQRQNDLFALLRGICEPTASLFYNHQLRWRDGVLLHPVLWFRPNGWQMRQEIIWDRAGGMMFNARMFCRFDERVLWFVADSWKWNQASVGHGTIWRVARRQQQQGKAHPVAFPLEIPSRCIAASTDPDDVVLDPFCGEGTTLRAAKNLGRRALGIELDEQWCEVAAERCRQEVLDLGGAA